MSATARLGKERGTLALEGVVTNSDMAKMLDGLASRLLERDDLLVDGQTGALNASGNLDLMLHVVPPGKDMSVLFVVIEAAGYTPGTPYSGGAGSYVSLHRDNPAAPGTMVDFSTSSTGLLPIKFDYGSDSPIIRSSQALWIRVNGGPASVTISASWQATLRTTVTP